MLAIRNSNSGIRKTGKRSSFVTASSLLHVTPATVKPVLPFPLLPSCQRCPFLYPLPALIFRGYPHVLHLSTATSRPVVLLYQHGASISVVCPCLSFCSTSPQTSLSGHPSVAAVPSLLASLARNLYTHRSYAWHIGSGMGRIADGITASASEEEGETLWYAVTDKIGFSIFDNSPSRAPASEGVSWFIYPIVVMVIDSLKPKVLDNHDLAKDPNTWQYYVHLNSAT